MPDLNDVDSFASRLKLSGARTWAEAAHHPMVARIGDGSLPHDVFGYYFSQNIPYLEDYARAIALTISRARDPESLRVLSRFLTQIVEVELPANHGFAARLGSRRAPRHLVGYAYTRHLLDTCSRFDTVTALAALLPCQWSYGEIGVRLLAAETCTDEIYRDWIAMFSNSDYGALVDETTGLIDLRAEASDLDAAQFAFNTSVAYERDFWSMAYQEGGRETVGIPEGGMR